MVQLVEALRYKPEGRGFDSRGMNEIYKDIGKIGGTRWCSWLRHCATSRKVAGSIGIFH